MMLAMSISRIKLPRGTTMWLVMLVNKTTLAEWFQFEQRRAHKFGIVYGTVAYTLFPLTKGTCVDLEPQGLCST